jgi:hypothetical protein
MRWQTQVVTAGSSSQTFSRVTGPVDVVADVLTGRPMPVTALTAA